MDTDISICNLALSLLAGNRITSFTASVDDSVEAELCSDNYEQARDYTLEARDWTFARTRVELDKDTVAPDFGYGSKMELPEACLIARRVSSCSDFKTPIDYSKEGRWILCDWDTIYVAYTRKETDVTLFSPSFTQALAYRIASILAIPLTESKSLEKRMETKFQLEVMEAGGKDGTQSKVEQIRTTTLTSARYRRGARRDWL